MEAKTFVVLEHASKDEIAADLYVNSAEKESINSEILEMLVEVYGERKAIFIFNEAKEATENVLNAESKILLGLIKNRKLLKNRRFTFKLTNISVKGEKFLNDLTGCRDTGSITFIDDPLETKKISGRGFDEFFCLNNYISSLASLEWDYLESFVPSKLDPYKNSTACYLIEKTKTGEQNSHEDDSKIDKKDLDSLLAGTCLINKNLSEWKTPEEFVSYMLRQEELKGCESSLDYSDSKNERMILFIEFPALLDFLEKHICNMNNQELKQIAKALLKTLQEDFPSIFNGITKPCIANGYRCIKPVNKSCGLYPTIKKV